MGRVSFAKDHQSFFVAGLFNEAVGGEVATRWVSGDEVLLGEEGLGASIVASSKMNLG